MNMNMLSLRLGLPGLLLLVSTASADSYINSYSFVCPNGESPSLFDGSCGLDYRLEYRYGPAASSSVSRRNFYLPSGGGGYDYLAEAAAVGAPNSFGLFSSASGISYTTAHQYSGMYAVAQVQYHDEVTLPGTGFGKLLVPWRIMGNFDITAISGAAAALSRPYGYFGVSFCQSIRTGYSAGGLGCAGGGVQNFTTSTAYDMIFPLMYDIEFGVNYSLNTTFKLGVGSGMGVGSGLIVGGAVADFSRTGLQQPASVYDSNGNLLPNAVIISASGVNYRNPQAIPVPAAAWLFGSGLLGLIGIARRKRV